MLEAQICAIEPRNNAHGIRYVLPLVQPIFWEAATKVTIDRPNTPSAVGSDMMILVSVTGVCNELGMELLLSLAIRSVETCFVSWPLALQRLHQLRHCGKHVCLQAVVGHAEDRR